MPPPAIVAAAVELYTSDVGLSFNFRRTFVGFSSDFRWTSVGFSSDFRQASVQLSSVELPSDVRLASLLTSSSCVQPASLLTSSPCVQPASLLTSLPCVPVDVIVLCHAGVIHLPSCALLSCRLDVLRPRPAALTSYVIPYCNLAFYTLWSCILWSCVL